MKLILKLFFIPIKMILRFTKLILYFFQFLGIYIFGFLSLFCFFGALLAIYARKMTRFDIISIFAMSFFFFLIPIFVDWLIDKIDDLIDFLDYLTI